MTRKSIAALLFLVYAHIAAAQVGVAPVTTPIVYPTSASLPVTTISANVALANAPANNVNAYPSGLITNSGSSIAWYVKGNSSVVATTAGIPVLPGQCVTDWFGFPTVGGIAPTNIAAITQTGTATLLITQATSEQQCGGGPSATTTTISGTIQTNPGPLTPVALDAATVTAGGTAVSASIAGHHNKGGWLLNPIGATINLCVNEQATASGTTSAGALTCVLPGQVYNMTPNATSIVSVVTSDSSHPFSGQGYN